MHSISNFRTGFGRGIPPTISRRPLVTAILPANTELQAQLLDVRRLHNVFQTLTGIKPNRNSQSELSLISEDIKSMCTSEQAINEAVDLVYKYSVESKESAHIGAILCNYLKDIGVGKTKFKLALLRKIQDNYEDRETKYNQLDLFLLNVTFMCEVFHHMRLSNGERYACLVPAMNIYFSMILDGGSEKEVQVFIEQLPKCLNDMKTNYPDKFNELLLKIRKLIISESSSVVTRSLLLQTLEQIHTGSATLNQKAKAFYQMFAKPTVNICE